MRILSIREVLNTKLLTKNKNYISAVLFVFLFAFLLQANAQDSTKPAKTYTDTISFIKKPKRITKKYPLSHQKDKKWVLQKRLSDEFNTKKLNLKKWYNTNPTWLGRKPSMASASNVAIKNGELVLSINKTENAKYKEGYTHDIGWVVSKKSLTYGYLEMRAKLMDAPWVSCFWLYNWWYKDNWRTEIDICENNPGYIYNRNDLNSNLHVFSAPPDKGDIKELVSFGKKYYIPFELQNDYHVWGLEWNKDVIKWYIDGVLFRETPNEYWHQDLHINFNSESNKWLQAFPDDNRLNKTYNIDYIRVWKRK